MFRPLTGSLTIVLLAGLLTSGCGSQDGSDRRSNTDAASSAVEQTDSVAAGPSATGSSDAPGSTDFSAPGPDDELGRAGASLGSVSGSDAPPSASGAEGRSSVKRADSTLPAPNPAAGGGRDVLDERAQQYLIRGQRAFQGGDYERAVAYLDSAEQVEPEASVVPFNRGRILVALNRYEGAQRAFKTAVRRDPNYPDAREQLGDLERQRGNLRAALDYYQDEEQIDPTSSLFVQMGEIHARLGNADSARVLYERALELDSTNANAHMMYGQFLEETGNLKEALAHSRRALSLNPERPNYEFAVGSQLYQLGRMEEAVPHLRSAADARLLHYPAQYNLGQALMRLGREEEADRYMARADSARALMDRITRAQSAATRNPKSVGEWIRLGELFRQADERERAKRAFSRAASLEPQNARVHSNLGEMMLEEDDAERALKHFQLVLKTDRSRPQAWRNLAVAYARMGDCASARKVLRLARQRHPGSSVTGEPLPSGCP